MSLLNGEILWNLLWVLPLFFLLFYTGWQRRNSLLKRFLGKRAEDPSYTSASKIRRFWRAVLLACALILLFVAAARPSWGVSIQPYTGQGRDIMVVFDTSRSMLAQDVRPSRLEHAKWLVRELVKMNPGDRFGLIAFAGQAFLECPLTIDKTSFLASLDDLSTDTIPVGGTNIEQALATAVHGFRAAETSHRAILLITDGDELYGDSGKAVGEIIKLKIPLFIAGIGDPAQPSLIQVPDEQGGLRTLKDSQGNIVKSPLNERGLSALAQKTGGIYVRSTTTDPGLKELEARIQKLAKQEIDSGKQTRPIERPVYPLVGAFLLLCVWFCLSEKRMNGTAAKTMLLFGLLFAGAASFAAEDAQLPNSKEAPQQEAPAPEEKGMDRDATPVDLYNDGLKAQEEEKDTQKALKLYEQAIGTATENQEVRARSYQNLGVINHQQARAVFDKAQKTLAGQQLDAALKEVDQTLKQIAMTQDIYKEALRESVEIPAVARNQQLLLIDRKKAEELKKKIEELKKQQQEAQKNAQQAKDQQQKQNQQKQNQQKQDQSQQKQAQEQNKGKEAEEHLKKALEELGGSSDKQEQNKDRQDQKDQKKSDQSGKSDENKDRNDRNKDQDKKQEQDKNNDDQNKDRELPKESAEQQQAQAEEDNKDIDKNQAKALLDLMSNDEKLLKDELKDRMKRARGVRPIEKDW